MLDLSLGRGKGLAVFILLCLVLCASGPLFSDSVKDGEWAVARTACSLQWESSHIGGAVLLGIKQGDIVRIFFVTARHVATENGFFNRNREGMHLLLPTRNHIVLRWKSMIAPERWLTGPGDVDLAWFEFSQDEIAQLRSEGARLEYVPVAGDMMTGLKSAYDDFAAVGTTVLEERDCATLPQSDAISLCAFYHSRSWQSGCSMEDQSNVLAVDRLAFVPSYPVRIVTDLPKNDCLKKISHLQFICNGRMEHGDSGRPCFLKVDLDGRTRFLLMGLQISIFSPGIEKSGVTPIEPMVDCITGRMRASRLIDHPELQ